MHCIPNAGGLGLIPGQGTKIPHATGLLSPCDTMKTHRSQREKKKMRDKQGMMMVKAQSMSSGLGVHWKLGQPQACEFQGISVQRQCLEGEFGYQKGMPCIEEGKRPREPVTF